MKRVIVFAVLLAVLLAPAVRAEEVPVPPEAEEYMPQDWENPWAGLGQILEKALTGLDPALKETFASCASILAISVLCSLFQAGALSHGGQAARLAGAAGIFIVAIRDTGGLFSLGLDTVNALCDYAGTLVPVLTASMAAGGMVHSASGLYVGTVLFLRLLSRAVEGLLLPMLRCYIALGFANAALGDELLGRLRDFIKSMLTWGLKLLLYAFSGYMMITGVISGAADKSAVKAAKVVLSTMVPVVGGLVADTSETLVLSADLLRSTLGIGGMLAVVAVCAGPFLRLGVRYLMLKLTGALCAVTGNKETAGFADCISGAMGLLLAMTGVCCLMLLISCVCFMKGAIQ